MEDQCQEPEAWSPVPATPAPPLITQTAGGRSGLHSSCRGKKYFNQKYFSVPPGQRVELRWDSFNVGCDGNYVEIVDGLNSGNIRRLIPRLKLRNIFLLKLTNIIV